MIKATFLTERQIWGDEALDIFKEYGVAAAPTDLAIILGAFVSEKYKDSAGNPAGLFWSASRDENGNVRCAHTNGDEYWRYTESRGISARPALLPSFISGIKANEVSGNVKKTGGIIKTVQFGEFPQTAVDNETAECLEHTHKNELLHITGKGYTFDEKPLDAYSSPAEWVYYTELTYRQKRYIRVLGKPYNKNSITHDGRKVISGHPYWVETQPIEWLVDPSGIWLPRESLFAGIRYVDVEMYLKNYFVPQMLCSSSKGIKLTDVFCKEAKTCFNCRYNIDGLCSNEDNVSHIKSVNSIQDASELVRLLEVQNNIVCASHKFRGK